MHVIVADQILAQFPKQVFIFLESLVHLLVPEELVAEDLRVVDE